MNRYAWHLCAHPVALRRPCVGAGGSPLTGWYVCRLCGAVERA